MNVGCKTLYSTRKFFYELETINVKVDDIELKLEKKEKGFLICIKRSNYVAISVSLGFYYSEGVLIRKMNIFATDGNMFWMHLPKR